jgi:NADPH-dependent 2,4-dienoyl-CoA reductase/sulfur reductase-like enzyme
MPPRMRDGGRLVIIGGDAAGMSAASRARRLRPDVEIVVLERGDIVSYSACSLPYYISGTVGSREDLIVHDPEFFRRERHIDVRTRTEAVEVRPRERMVVCRTPLGEESLGYDALVIATGARAVRPPLPGVDLPGVFTLRSVPDGDAIRRRLEELGAGKAAHGAIRAAIIGGGYIGLEMAEALVARGARVTIIELLPNLLSTYDPDMSDLVLRELLDRDVIVRTDTRVEGFEPGDGAHVGCVRAGGQRLSTDIVLMSVGVRPRVELASAAGIGLGRSGAIAVNPRQVTSEPAILAAGDCCEAPHIVTGRSTWIPLGTTANKQGRVAGENAVGGDVKFTGVAGTSVTGIFGLAAAQTGLSTAAAEREGFAPDSVRIAGVTRAHAYPGGGRITVKLVFDTGSARLLGAQIVGVEGVAKRIDTVAAALTAGMSVMDLAAVDMSYAPPFSPVWDPILVAANQAVKKLAR